MIDDKILLEIAERYGIKVSETEEGKGGIFIMEDGIKKEVSEELIKSLFDTK